MAAVATRMPPASAVPVDEVPAAAPADDDDDDDAKARYLRRVQRAKWRARSGACGAPERRVGGRCVWD
jgi:hypothetical protein